MRSKLIVLLICCCWYCGWSQPESWYVEQLNECHFHGITEKSVYGGRVDILTDSLAIEVEFAPKWKNAIGQALWYALQTNKAAGIVLILRSSPDFHYLQMLQSTIDHSNLADDIMIKVWPIDFDMTFESSESLWQSQSADTKSNLPSEKD